MLFGPGCGILRERFETGEGGRTAGFTILPAAESDLAAVLEIESACYPRPWSRQQFLDELAAPHAHLDLLRFDGTLSGYICYWLAAGELHILNVATAPAWRRRGVARHLLQHAMRLANQRQAERALLEVRRGNAAAIALYRAMGFGDDAVRRGYYADGEDALLMSCPLSEASPHTPGDRE